MTCIKQYDVVAGIVTKSGKKNKLMVWYNNG